MPHRLGPNQYGKADIRIVRVTRDTPRHEIADLDVSVALRGDFAGTHRSGDNTGLLTTDAMKNTAYAFAKEHGIGSPERFGLLLARRFAESVDSVHGARVRIGEHAWDRLPPDPAADPTAGPAGPDAPDAPAHSFVRRGTEVRTAEAHWDAATGAARVVSGLTGLTVLNSAGSEFHGFLRDRYTTLAETRDRILATMVTARWRYRWTGDGPEPDWDACWAGAREALLAAFAGTYSRSLQQTLLAMGGRVLDRRPEIDEVRLSLPNRHHVEVDLAPFGSANGNEVFVAADRPYGLIEGTVLRDGADALIPTDD